jgi:hypothetical protein
LQHPLGGCGSQCHPQSSGSRCPHTHRGRLTCSRKQSVVEGAVADFSNLILFTFPNACQHRHCQMNHKSSS